MDRSSTRRWFLRAVAGAGVGAAGCTAPARPDTRTDDPEQSPGSRSPSATGDAAPPDAVGLEHVASGFQGGVDVAFAPDGDRRYVAVQNGRVLVHEADGLREEPLLDLGDGVVVGGEQGLLGIALHPEFASNGRVYVRYSAPPRPGTPDGYSHTFVLSEFTTADGRRVDPDSERTLLAVPEPQGNHNAGDILFGPDGLLYVAVGDGGAAGDQGRGHVDDWYDAVGGGNGQDVTSNLLGSILRIDVDGRTDDKPYAVPGDNPLVGREGLDEHYAWGLRNPWRMSVDPAGERVDGGPDLYVGDVGQNRYEEVDLVRPGGNYGWNVREGGRCYEADDCPDAAPGDEPLRDPVVAYPHSNAAVSGISVIGGYVYRGDALPGLAGRYVFADWRADGRLFVADPDAGWEATTLPVDPATAVGQVRSFGRDHDGELYVVAAGDGGWAVYRLVPA